jgi:hypothetical protein
VEEKMNPEQQEEQAAAIGGAPDELIKQDAESVVEAVKEMVEDKGLPEGAVEAPEETKEMRIQQLKDELERLETGLPNAGATVRAIRDKQQKVPRRDPNTPDVHPGDVSKIVAQEAAKYAGALGPMPGMSGMAMPSMAYPVGPQVPVGPQAPVGPQKPGPTTVPHAPAPAPQQTRTIELDPKTLIEVELVSTKKRLAEANERLAAVALSDARKAKHVAEQEEAALMARVTKQYGIPYGKNLRLVDKEKGICLIEG